MPKHVMNEGRQSEAQARAAGIRAMALQSDPAARAFQKRLAGLSKLHPGEGLRLTHGQYHQAIEDDPGGHEAWSQFEHVLILRPDR